MNLKLFTRAIVAAALVVTGLFASAAVAERATSHRAPVDEALLAEANAAAHALGIDPATLRWEEGFVFSPSARRVRGDERYAPDGMTRVAATDFFISLQPDSASNYTLFVDTFDPPTTERARSVGSFGNSASAIVPKGLYYRITCEGACLGVIHVISLGN